MDCAFRLTIFPTHFLLDSLIHQFLMSFSTFPLLQFIEIRGLIIQLCLQIHYFLLISLLLSYSPLLCSFTTCSPFLSLCIDNGGLRIRLCFQTNTISYSFSSQLPNSLNTHIFSTLPFLSFHSISNRGLRTRLCLLNSRYFQPISFPHLFTSYSALSTHAFLSFHGLSITAD